MTSISKIQKDAELASQLVKTKFIKDDVFKEYDGIYAFTNENIKGYFNRLNFEQKNILTVAASGDHIFEALLRNSKNIDSFDINKLTKYFINLKEAAIKTLDLNEFITFFCLDSNYDVFNEQIYNKIRPKLKTDDLLFWDILYSKFPGKTLRCSNLFHDTEETYNFLKHSLYYLQKEYYQKLKEILINMENENKSINIDIYDITKKRTLPRNDYDIILLSNIADYIEDFYDKDHLEKFKKLITKNLNAHLNNNGIICVAYLFWAHYLNQKRLPLIEKDKLRNQYFKDNFEEWIIDNSIIRDYTTDYILIYKKQL